MDEDSGVLELQERQRHNVPEELAGGTEWIPRPWDDITLDVHAGHRGRSGTSAIGRHQ
jgi:hypothetical protein